MWWVPVGQPQLQKTSESSAHAHLLHEGLTAPFPVQANCSIHPSEPRGIFFFLLNQKLNTSVRKKQLFWGKNCTINDNFCHWKQLQTAVETGVGKLSGQLLASEIKLFCYRQTSDPESVTRAGLQPDLTWFRPRCQAMTAGITAPCYIKCTFSLQSVTLSDQAAVLVLRTR